MLYFAQFFLLLLVVIGGDDSCIQHCGSVGDACNATLPCKLGMDCVQSHCVGWRWLSLPPPPSSSASILCNSSAECQATWLQSGFNYVCVNQTCRIQYFPNDYCTSDADCWHGECSETAQRCRGSTSSCSSPFQTGECQKIDQYCNGSYCVDRLPMGATCAVDLPCAVDAFCSADKQCTRLGAVVDGGACEDSLHQRRISACQEDYICSFESLYNTSSALQCRPQPTFVESLRCSVATANSTCASPYELEQPSKQCNCDHFLGYNTCSSSNPYVHAVNYGCVGEEVRLARCAAAAGCVSHFLTDNASFAGLDDENLCATRECKGELESLLTCQCHVISRLQPAECVDSRQVAAYYNGGRCFQWPPFMIIGIALTAIVAAIGLVASVYYVVVVHRRRRRLRLRLAETERLVKD